MSLASRVESISLSEAVNHQILHSSRETYRKLQPSATGQPYDKVVVGAAAFRYTLSGQTKIPAVLLLKRAADEAYYPNVFELPSGKVDPEDATLKHALAREVREETGLDILEILAELNPMVYSTQKTVTDGNDQSVSVSKSAIQLNYVVSVSVSEVKLNTNEHSESRWAREEELDELLMTSEMRVVTKEAFKWAARQGGLPCQLP